MLNSSSLNFHVFNSFKVLRRQSFNVPFVNKKLVLNLIINIHQSPHHIENQFGRLFITCLVNYKMCTVGCAHGFKVKWLLKYFLFLKCLCVGQNNIFKLLCFKPIIIFHDLGGYHGICHPFDHLYKPKQTYSLRPNHKFNF